ncbi:MAG: ribonucleoside-triphosphate reductase, adenosylcobalamin-dependent [Thiothrix sp.]|uniref:ribonucleoside-triphosphate reductase, adenosylcobalamin-dependent n=1 Tax=Thiothrix sp. TaxID=1032 RepID=UPI00261495F5|nr:ribonucleoside-triphosphate reductase, adenosylcobalamin-dependent [Thiothrix sp.]MDD5395274.1 ribonucleoside-triphosphate reductase, adenosylcobalamin-dependent [Thiothrix sp.]
MTQYHQNKLKPSTRAEVITRRTYCRPTEDGTFETWDDVIDRVIRHQEWLWARAQGHGLRAKQREELGSLRTLLLQRKALVSGRTLWLGGTSIAREREASMFNCSFGRIATVYDLVDAYWLLLQGCGVGFEPTTGTLSGFSKPVELKIIRSTKTDPTDKGNPLTVETFEELPPQAGNGKRYYDWTIRVGDSAEAWAKLPGKILANKRFVKTLTLDYGEIRPAGTRLSSYGWISSGDSLLSEAMRAIVTIMNLRAGQLLTRINIMDILNHLGATLSSRRSAEITLVPYGDPEWIEFARAKHEYWNGNSQRGQSNNSVVFYHKPSEAELSDIFGLMVASGGSEPGFINGASALKRAPWFRGVNPCAEILLGDKSFCNLVEVDLGKFNGDFDGLKEAYRLIARANYRQTCVYLVDGMLQRTWHELNDFLRLCGVGPTGIRRWEHHRDGAKWKELKGVAIMSAIGMADELTLPRPRAVTTVKPSGTLGKIMDTTEGAHLPLGRYLWNNVKFSKHDPLVDVCRKANYRVFDAPGDTDGVIVTFPVEYPDVKFDVVERDGEELHVNLESAVEQLEFYKLLMTCYVEHNCSITISYDPSEVPAIVAWLHENWEHYVGVSFLLRNDPTKTAKDLGFEYLPQEVVTKRQFDEYSSKLKPIRVMGSLSEIEEDRCATGACPIK